MFTFNARKRKFRIEGEFSIEENLNLDLLTAIRKGLDGEAPMTVFHLELLDDLFRYNNELTDKKESQFQKFKEELKSLVEEKILANSSN